MKVLLINGSPKSNGCTFRALKEVEKTLNAEDIETELVHIGNKEIRGCIACGYCMENKKCVFNDVVNEVALKFQEADGIVIGSPVYYSGCNGTVLAFLDRLFHSTHFSKKMKVGAAVISSRRAGSTTALDEIYKYYGICNMPIVTSNYWNEVHGSVESDVEEDIEGLQTMRELGKNMAFLIKSINLGKKEYGVPESEKKEFTNFVR